MYTQCPDCQTAFRVTATVLQQAGGRVRCGNCGHAFSALERLAEDPPVGEPLATGNSPRDDDAVLNVSELGGDDPDDESGEAPGDEDANALLDTLNELAGSDDIRIEDTGVEWLVIDEDNPEEASMPDGLSADETASLRWYLDDEQRDSTAAADNDAQLPEVRDEVPLAELPEAAVIADGILVEDPGVGARQEPLALPKDDSSELRFDDDTPLPEDFDDSREEPAPPESAQRRAEDRIEPRTAEFDERQVDLALSEPDDWRQLLDEVADPASRDGSHATPPVALESTAAGDLDDTDIGPIDAAADSLHDEPDADLSGPSDIDTQVDLQALEPDGPVEDFAWTSGADYQDEDNALEAELAAAYTTEDTEAAEPDPEEVDAEAAEPDLPYHVPPQTEEEMTINMQIDQELLRFAEEDAGFAATQSGVRRMPEDSLLVETIIMEGDFVRTALDKELDDAVRTVAESGDDDPRRLLDTYISSKEKIRGGRRRTDPPSYAAMAGIAALALVLLAQAVHAYRESLATYGAFNQTIGTVYRWFGDPLVPAWDIRGWRFESTSGSTDAGDAVLTIRSRISNQSGGALPYPLLHVSLTDRYEEIIGSKVLQPADYLDDSALAGGAVAAGDAFTAVITVASLAQTATGFKLNVCYRVNDEQLRCATEDFRN
jgi:predicted Zn finger-like uncharacterized protein